MADSSDRSAETLRIRLRRTLREPVSGTSLLPYLFTSYFFFRWIAPTRKKDTSPIYVRVLPLYPLSPCLFHNKLF